jgi:uroporphyrin-III C-methyltransferase/precorrin-2 dehydrogenase/sirohydrochlorin ferrochelatase
MLLPLFLNLSGRTVVLVGGGHVARGKLQQLLAAGARVRVVAPEVCEEIAGEDVEVARRGFADADLDGAWLVVAAASPEVNRQVAAAAEARRIFVNAVDDPPNASAFLAGVVRRGGVTLAISTSGAAPALTALVREAIDAVLPDELDTWMEEARRQRTVWKRDRVPMPARKPLLLQALNGIYDDKASGDGPRTSGATGYRLQASDDGHPASEAAAGHVSLVGAGPGDPGLLTRRGIARLRAADLVLYDALIDDRILRYARKAQRFFVGKRSGRQAMTQSAVERVMVRAAKRGRRVVRLKGGDPFVFGRGGEEMLALLRAGVPFDVVPGVTSAVAAPALAGIPVTHRGVSTALLVVSGHDGRAFERVAGRLDIAGVTLVILMGRRRAGGIAQALLDCGWSGSTPAAIVFDASGADQDVWRGTIQGLAAAEPCDGEGRPATIIVGDVVNIGMEAAIDERNERARERRR